MYEDKLGENLSRLRKGAGLSQVGLARRIGVAKTFIGQIERGDKQPSVSTLMKLATTLGVSLDDLIPADIAVSSASMQE